jgi:predicted Zn-dependent peptidase
VSVALALLWCAPQETRFVLDNGLRVVVNPRPEAQAAVVGLAFAAGVWTEPDGRCGVTHLCEHLFLVGPTKSWADPFETLARLGATGRAFADVNAETMWAATYFYASLKPSDEAAVETALKIFAEKLDHARFTPELLARERPRVLEEIRNTGPFFERMKDRVRLPKAGIEAQVQALTLEDVVRYRAAVLRPSRAVLVVVGPVRPDEVRARIETLFGPLRDPKAQPLAAAEGGEAFAYVTHRCAAGTDAERAAVRVAGAAWQRRLRASKARAFVEWAAPDEVRAILFGGEAAAIRVARDGLADGLTAAELRAARADATESARAFSAAPPGNSPQAIGQGAVNRMIFEIEGGRAFLDAAAALSPEDVRAAAGRLLRAETEVASSKP